MICLYMYILYSMNRLFINITLHKDSATAKYQYIHNHIISKILSHFNPLYHLNINQ